MSNFQNLTIGLMGAMDLESEISKKVTNVENRVHPRSPTAPAHIFAGLHCQPFPYTGM